MQPVKDDSTPLNFDDFISVADLFFRQVSVSTQLHWRRRNRPSPGLTSGDPRSPSTSACCFSAPASPGPPYSNGWRYILGSISCGTASSSTEAMKQKEEKSFIIIGKTMDQSMKDASSTTNTSCGATWRTDMRSHVAELESISLHDCFMLLIDNQSHAKW